MARPNATARTAPQVKGRKSAASAPVVSKRTARGKRVGAARKSSRSAASRSGVHHLDTVVRVGTAITFAPTGERLRVAKIEEGQITFEKLP
jgi:hypothetical protein